VRPLIFRQCVVHKDHSKTHTHTMLTITQDEKKIVVPADVGETEKCMHPLHTHDTTGLIHMEYPLPVPFFLGDFFDVMGVSFSDTQVGAIRTYDGYKITVKKNGKRVNGMYRWIWLKDLDKIELEIESSK